MTDLDWHNITNMEETGGGYEYILDVSPGWMSDEAAEYKSNALVRTGKDGWNWWARRIPRDKKGTSMNDLGEALTKEEALNDGLMALDMMMAKDKLGTQRRE